MNYRETLKIRRKERKIQQDTFRLMGMSQAQYSKLERGNDAKLSTLERAALLLGLEIRLIPVEIIAEVDLLISSELPPIKNKKSKSRKS